MERKCTKCKRAGHQKSDRPYGETGDDRFDPDQPHSDVDQRGFLGPLALLRLRSDLCLEYVRDLIPHKHDILTKADVEKLSPEQIDQVVRKVKSFASE